MLYRRLGKLQTLLSCNASLEKAKPEKKAAVSMYGIHAVPHLKLTMHELSNYTLNLPMCFISCMGDLLYKLENSD